MISSDVSANLEISCEGPNLPPIYVDYNATTPLEPCVVDAVTEGLYLWANPSSSHPLSCKAAEEIDIARERVAQLLNVEKLEVIFTSGGTESNNWIIQSAIAKYIEGNPSKVPHVICSAIEHPSILNKLHDLVNHKLIELSECEIDMETGMVDLELFQRSLRENTCLVTVMLANNETGVIQPIREISEILKKNEAKLGGACLFHTDASQAIGKMRVDLIDLGADSLTVVGHKFYGPRNGALIVRQPWKSLYLKPLLFGGNQEFGFRSGTENTPMIMGLGAAAELSHKNIDIYAHHLKDIRDYFEERLGVELQNNHVVNFANSPRLPNTSSVSFPNYPGNACELLESCKSFLASTGAACHTGAVRFESVFLISNNFTLNQLTNKLSIASSQCNTNALALPNRFRAVAFSISGLPEQLYSPNPASQNVCILSIQPFQKSCILLIQPFKNGCILLIQPFKNGCIPFNPLSIMIAF